MKKNHTEYDYQNQAWVVDGKYVRCGHSEEMDCQCYGRIHEGEEYRNQAVSLETIQKILTTD